MLVVVTREHLLPDAFAVSELLEVTRVHRAVETEQLPALPDQDGECRDQQTPGHMTVNPADQAACRKDADESRNEFS